MCVCDLLEVHGILSNHWHRLAAAEEKSCRHLNEETFDHYCDCDSIRENEGNCVSVALPFHYLDIIVFVLPDSMRAAATLKKIEIVR